MALSGDSQPHFTTIANFVAQMKDVIQPIFTAVLMVCDNQGLIGREMFAIDGCKLPSNASKEWSGTHAEMNSKQKKIDRAVKRMLAVHREEDVAGQVNDHTRRHKEEQRIAKLKDASAKIKKHLETSTDRLGPSGSVEPMLDQVGDHLGKDYVETVKLTTDSGFHSKATIDYCDASGADAYMADGNFRKRDPRFAENERHHPTERKPKYFSSSEFSYDQDSGSCQCPAGKPMWKRYERESEGQRIITFTGHLDDCRNCPMQKKCMRKQPTKNGRQVTLVIGDSGTSSIEQMKRKIDSAEGRYIYEQRLGTVEPVIGNINTTKRLNRFSHRGKKKINAHWMMFRLVHNVEKIQRYGALG